jgi:hypothetical protein
MHCRARSETRNESEDETIESGARTRQESEDSREEKSACTGLSLQGTPDEKLGDAEERARNTRLHWAGSLMMRRTGLDTDGGTVVVDMYTGWRTGEDPDLCKRRSDEE